MTEKAFFFETADSRIMVAGYTVNGVSFSPGKPRLWSNKRLTAPTSDQNYDVAPDGTRIEGLVTTPAVEETKAPIYVTFLLNFFDELRYRVPAGK